MTLMGLVNSYGSLIACRLLLGAAESGLFPGKEVLLETYVVLHISRCRFLSIELV
jgi:hypothetical protein